MGLFNRYASDDKVVRLKAELEEAKLELENTKSPGVARNARNRIKNIEDELEDSKSELDRFFESLEKE